MPRAFMKVRDPKTGRDLVSVLCESPARANQLGTRFGQELDGSGIQPGDTVAVVTLFATLHPDLENHAR